MISSTEQETLSNGMQPPTTTGTNTETEMLANKDDDPTTRGREVSASGPGASSSGRVLERRRLSSSADRDSSQRSRDNSPSSTSSSSGLTNAEHRKRHRFTIKYIGSALLHKNFTLPMLEWIARDIKRQTVRGAQSTNQRQFTIPARDIIFEIHPKQLTAISCKDGHCIFVHPMHCVSKYAQLQHDPTCFSYLIRDNKESPSFCHVFQAKSVSKVHDLFSAIREATTRTQLNNIEQTGAAGGCGRGACDPVSDIRRVLKSASADGQSTCINKGFLDKKQQHPSTSSSSSSVVHGSNQAHQHRQHHHQQHQQPQNQQQPEQQCHQQQMSLSSAKQTTASASTNQQASAVKPMTQTFENTYQFEVMFVKKVKLQCRRVPASFVDDALETLKSFEVLKGNELKATQIKGIGKRIINASVDERQEYDEACQSPTPGCAPASNDQHQRHKTANNNTTIVEKEICQRRDSDSPIINRQLDAPGAGFNERESRSCQQSPAKESEKNLMQLISNSRAGQTDEGVCANGRADSEIKKHQSMECLKSIDSTIRSAKSGDAPNYSNDFSPYNTITSNDLNERIAAMPAVSGSVSLDHETRQKLARQVRETIMATAASIKKGLYASGDKLDSSTSSKALDSLSCTATSEFPPIDSHNRKSPHEKSQLQDTATSDDSAKVQLDNEKNQHQDLTAADPLDNRRSSEISTTSTSMQRAGTAAGQSGANNFDLFRRASARQVVKNRTMLLLIGKDELCTISIDKHQMLFSKTFSSIVHCLQGNNNKDHFGLICRDSGKINPNAESYAGFIFKCQSDKVVREIMSALKQVIYSSQHNYHGYNSPYNPINAVTAGNQCKNRSPKGESFKLSGNFGSDVGQLRQQQPVSSSAMSSVAKSSFVNPIDIDEASKKLAMGLPIAQPMSADAVIGSPPRFFSARATNSDPQKNPVKSMFCDNCPLYWYHRLCIDIESLPADSSKAIILRRIDSSLTEQEQDELYSKFSDFKIDSIDEHNEIFMSLLRHLCEKKQLKHNQSHLHLSSMAKSSSLAKQQSLQSNSYGQRNASIDSGPKTSNSAGHHRSGSTSGSFAFVMGQSANTNQSIADAGSAAIDNLKRAKNTISVSIENMFRRRPSLKDEQDSSQEGDQLHASSSSGPVRTGSFKGHKEFGSSDSARTSRDDISGSLKRSQSTTDHQQANYGQSVSTWRDTLTKTIHDEMANPFVGLFRRRSSTFGSKTDKPEPISQVNGSQEERASADSLMNPRNGNQPVVADSNSSKQFKHPSITSENPLPLKQSGQQSGSIFGGASPSSVLSGVFWKKSIFDKIRQPVKTTNEQKPQVYSTTKSNELILDAGNETSKQTRKKSREELRSLWKKAIIEQITLLKMDQQNQKLQVTTNECNIQRMKLNYEDVLFLRDAPKLWDKMLRQDPTKAVPFVDVAKLVRVGVPKQRRGEIWMFLMNQYQLRHGTSFQPADSDYHGDANQSYRNLLSQLSVQQHEIFVDIGRTFPTHPYYSQYLSIGQLSLFNLLKAYSLLDPEVGYCQGLSFVAGILLLHVDSEDEAFELMRHLLFNFSLRKQYLPSMNALHLQLYQMTRLLRDFEYDLFNHFDRFDISPSLYAAPWFLTLFASQFSLGFVARLLDLIFLIGIEAIFRVSLKLLAYHRSSILIQRSLESTMDFMKCDLMKIEDKELAKIFDEAMSLDLRNKLIEYEIEYTFYCAEDKARFIGGHISRCQNKATNHNSDSENQGTVENNKEQGSESTALVADATATIIIQHLLANNHLKSLRSNYSC